MGPSTDRPSAAALILLLPAFLANRMGGAPLPIFARGLEGGREGNSGVSDPHLQGVLLMEYDVQWRRESLS